jgi:predicted transcriptional regulator of viral defense system
MTGSAGRGRSGLGGRAARGSRGRSRSRGWAYHVLRLASSGRPIRIREVLQAGIHPEYVRRLYHRGVLTRLSRGAYTLASGPTGDRFAVALASVLVPNGIVCLGSALKFHGIETGASTDIWVAIDAKAWQPRPKEVPLRVVRFSGDALSKGVEEHDVEGVPVRVYSLAKTVADCFRFRNKIGQRAVLDALWQGWRQSRFTRDELQRWAEVRRVANVMRPYLESLV